MIRTSDGAMQRQFGVLFDAGSLGAWGDGALLDRFLAGRDDAAEAAFASLVERHGPMVLRVCRANLGDEHDAHDAFQATFLILARKARSVRIRDTVGPWLHGVAWRVASRARAASYRRRRHERRAAEMAPRSFDESRKDDAEATLHEEVLRLPSGFRDAVILCDLEGLTTDQAAERLGTPVGTVRSRLYRGRDRLRGRLLRRGLAPAAVGVVVASAPASALTVPAALADATVGLAVGWCWAGTVPIRLAWLVNGGRYAMGMKSVAAVGLSLGLVAGVGGYAAQGPGSRSGGKVESKRGEPGERVRSVQAPVADPTATDHDRLQGRWTVLKIREGDKKPVDYSHPALTVQFRGDEFKVLGIDAGEREFERGTFRIDAESRPRALLVAGAGKSKEMLYAFEGDRLKLAFTQGDDAPRAKSFDDPGPDPEHPVAVWELVREAAPASGGDRPAADVRSERERLQGTWSVIKASLNGREIDGPGILFAPMTFKGDEVKFGPFGNPPVENSYRFLIDPEGEPRALRVVREGGKPRWWLYSLKGDKLRTAAWQSIDDPRRPEGFEGGDDNSPLIVLELVRNVPPPATEGGRTERRPDNTPGIGPTAYTSTTDRTPDPTVPSSLPPSAGPESAIAPEREPSAIERPAVPATPAPSAAPALPAPADLTPTAAPAPSVEPPAPAEVPMPPADGGPPTPTPVSLPSPPLASANPFEPADVSPPSVTQGIPAPAPGSQPQPPQPSAMTRPQPAGTSDLRRLQGTWSVLALESDSQEHEPDPDSAVLFAGNALVFVWARRIVVRSRWPSKPARSSSRPVNSRAISSSRRRRTGPRGTGSTGSRAPCSCSAWRSRAGRHQPRSTPRPTRASSCSSSAASGPRARRAYRASGGTSTSGWDRRARRSRASRASSPYPGLRRRSIRPHSPYQRPAPSRRPRPPPPHLPRPGSREAGSGPLPLKGLTDRHVSGGTDGPASGLLPPRGGRVQRAPSRKCRPVSLKGGG